MKRIALRVACILLAIWIGIFGTQQFHHPFKTAMVSTAAVIVVILLLVAIGKAIKRREREKIQL